VRVRGRIRARIRARGRTVREITARVVAAVVVAVARIELVVVVVCGPVARSGGRASGARA